MITEHSQEFKQIVSDVLELAKKSGATSSEVGVSIDKGLSATLCKTGSHDIGQIRKIVYDIDNSIKDT